MSEMEITNYGDYIAINDHKMDQCIELNISEIDACVALRDELIKAYPLKPELDKIGIDELPVHKATAVVEFIHELIQECGIRSDAGESFPLSESNLRIFASEYNDNKARG